MAASPRFGDDVEFLRRHTETVVLAGEGGARVALCPALQGRVAVSAAAGEGGASFGWLNRALIASGTLAPHMNVYGGADRFWLGPEGGPFSLFFAPGAPQDLAHWQTPAPIDAEPFALAEAARHRALLRKAMRLTNAAGTVFELEVAREVRLYPDAEIWQVAGVAARAGVTAVGFETRNRVTNTGAAAWRRETGLVSIWIAGTFAPSPATTIVLPLGPGAGPAVNDRYFGRVPAERLLETDRAVYYHADGQQRGKIGIPPGRARPALGSYDARGPNAGVLTIVTFTLPVGARDYVNSLWGPQAAPYDGDAVNAYNDGPAAPGAAPFGPFYELETSSPALALRPGTSAEHLHRTLHFTGAPADLDAVARAALGVGVAEIAAAFGRAP
ncbi:MAG TPA: DUF6786 family protein [Polyangia bacterium]|nr:DUF6786 family protein [Polyangia bacterium]